MIDQPPAQQTVKTSVSAPATTTAAAKSKENAYTKPEIDKCYTYREPGHRSNECLKRNQVNIADYRDGVVIEETNDSDFAEEHGDFVAFVVQKLLCNQKFPDTKRHQIFY